MVNKITFSILTIAIAAVVAGISSIVLNDGIQSVAAQNPNPQPQGNGPTPYPQTGYPYGQLVQQEAQTGPGGFGQDIKDCRALGNCQGDDNQGLGYLRANDASPIADPGKPQVSQDDLSSPKP